MRDARAAQAAEQAAQIAESHPFLQDLHPNVVGLADLWEVIWMHKFVHLVAYSAGLVTREQLVAGVKAHDFLRANSRATPGEWKPARGELCES